MCLARDRRLFNGETNAFRTGGFTIREMFICLVKLWLSHSLSPVPFRVKVLSRLYKECIKESHE